MWERFKAVLLEVHSHPDTYFSYLVAASVTLQASWAELDDYIPPKWRHWIIGAATFVVVADRIVKSVKNTRPDLGPKI